MPGVTTIQRCMPRGAPADALRHQADLLGLLATRAPLSQHVDRSRISGCHEPVLRGAPPEIGGPNTGAAVRICTTCEIPYFECVSIPEPTQQVNPKGFW